MLKVSKFVPEDDHVLKVESHRAVEMTIQYSFHLVILPANDITAPGPSSQMKATPKMPSYRPHRTSAPEAQIVSNRVFGRAPLTADGKSSILLLRHVSYTSLLPCIRIFSLLPCYILSISLTLSALARW